MIRFEQKLGEIPLKRGKIGMTGCPLFLIILPNVYIHLILQYTPPQDHTVSLSSNVNTSAAPVSASRFA